MLAKTLPPSIVGVSVMFALSEVESFFTEKARLPKRAGKRRRFLYTKYRQALAEKVIRVILDYHYGALALRQTHVEALYQEVKLIDFTWEKERRKYAGDFILRIKYRMKEQEGFWYQSFHFVRDDISVRGGLSGKLYTIRRRFHGG